MNLCSGRQPHDSDTGTLPCRERLTLTAHLQAKTDGVGDQNFPVENKVALDSPCPLSLSFVEVRRRIHAIHGPSVLGLYCHGAAPTYAHFSCQHNAPIFPALCSLLKSPYFSHYSAGRLGAGLRLSSQGLKSMGVPTQHHGIRPSCILQGMW